MNFLHNRPGTVILSTLLAIGFIAAVGFALSGCADLSHYRKGDDCRDCYKGLSEILGTSQEK